MLCAVALHAQLKFGAKAGLNVSSLWGVTERATNYIDMPSPYPVLAGLLIGGYVRYDVSSVSWLGVQAELMFSMQGARNVHYWQLGEKHTIGALRQNYVILPLLLHFKPFSKTPLSFVLGEQVGWCVGRYVDGTNATDGSIFNNYGGAFVLGTQYAFSEHLAVDLRLTNGNTPTLEVDETDLAIVEQAKGSYVYKSYGAENLVLQLSVSWTF